MGFTKSTIVWELLLWIRFNKKYGEKKLLEKIARFGFQCSLRVVPDPDARTKRKLKYPPSAYYILEVDKVLTISNK